MNNLGLGPMNILAARRANQMRLMQMGRAPSVIGASAPRPGPDMGTQLGQGLGSIGKMLGEFGKQRKADQAHEAATKAVYGLLNTDRNAAMEAGGGPSIQAAEQMATTKPAIPERLNNIMRALTESGNPGEAMKVYQQVMLREAPE